MKKSIIKKIFHTIYSTYMSIRFPFLYPRNLFTGNHYNNWKIIEKLKAIHREAYKYGTSENNFKIVCINKRKAILYNILKWYHDKFLQVIFCIPEFSYFDWFADGWKKSFAIEFCKEIKKSLIEDGGRKLLNEFHVTDIKEKYGTLCFYTNFSTDNVDKIIHKYEYISERTCIRCGKQAYGKTDEDVWTLPYCKNCYEKLPDSYKMSFHFYGTDEMPWYGYVSSKANKMQDDLKMKNEIKRKMDKYIDNEEFDFGHNIKHTNIDE